MLRQLGVKLILILFVCKGYNPKCLGVVDEQIQCFDAWHIQRDFGRHVIHNYSFYMAKINKKCIEAMTSPSAPTFSPVFEELTLYHIDTVPLAAVKKHHLLVIGYFRSIHAARYNRDIGDLLLRFAYVDIIKGLSPLTYVSKLMWDGCVPSNKGQFILQNRVAAGDWTFITEWLLACMAQEKAYRQPIDLHRWIIFNKEAQRCIFLHGDNFLHSALLRWLCKKWHIDHLFFSYSEQTYVLKHRYLLLWMRHNGMISDAKITFLVERAWDKKCYAFLFALALHGLLKKEHFPVNYTASQNIERLLTGNYRPDYHQANVLRYYLKKKLSRQKGKAILSATILNSVRYSQNKLLFLHKCYLPQDEIYFFSILMEIVIAAEIKPKAFKRLQAHHRKQEVMRTLNEASQRAMKAYIAKTLPPLIGVTARKAKVGLWTSAILVSIGVSITIISMGHWWINRSLTISA